MTLNVSSDSLPPLPFPTDITFCPEGGELHARMKVCEGEKVSSKLRFLGSALLSMGTVLGSLIVMYFDFVTWQTIGWFSIVLLLFTAGGAMLVMSRQIESVRAEIRISNTAMSIEETLADADLSQEFERDRIRAVSSGYRKKRHLLWTTAGKRPGQLPRLKFGSKSELQLLTADGHVSGLLSGWNQDDLKWLATAIASMWNLPSEVPILADTIRSARGIEEKYRRADGRSYRHPGFILFLLGFSIFLLVAGIYRLPRSMASMSWPAVVGRVTQSEYLIERGPKGGNGYSAEMKYSYNVADRNYDGDTISFSRNATEKLVHDFVTSHQVGSKVDVYFDPDDPTRSVLIPGPSLALWLIIGMGLFLLLLALYFFMTRVKPHHSRVGLYS